MTIRLNHALSRFGLAAFCASTISAACAQPAWNDAARTEYESILDKIGATATLAEAVVDQTSTVWSTAISNQGDFNVALRAFRESKAYKDVIAEVDKNRNEAERRVRLSHGTLSLSPPALDGMMTSYACMSRLVAYAKAPSGSLQSFNQETGRLTNECAGAIATARALVPLAK